MDDFPRRRRLEPQAPKNGGGLPILPLLVLVVFAGLLLGGILAKFFGGGGGAQGTPAPTFTPLPSAAPTATFAPRATPTHVTAASPSSSASAAPSPATAAPSGSPSPSTSASPTVAPTATPSPKPSVIFITPAPKPSVKKTVAPAVTATATPAPASGNTGADRAAAIVRSYLAAVLHGDQSTAAGYLSRGLPNETFYTGASRITDVQTTANNDGSFGVAVDMTTPTGEYYETFKLVDGPGGLQITDHYAIRVQ